MSLGAEGEMDSVFDIIQEVSAHLGPKDLIQAIANASRATAVPFDYMQIVLPADDPQTLVLYEFQQRGSKPYFSGSWTFFRKGTVSDWVLKNRQPLKAFSLDELKAFPGSLDEMIEKNLQSLYALPLEVNTKALGVLLYFCKKREKFSQVNFPLLERVSAATAVSVGICFDGKEVMGEKDSLDTENVRVEYGPNSDHPFDKIVGYSPKLHKVLHQVSQVAPLETTVLILGETGTGKELIAQAIHELSHRKDGPLVRVNCAGLPIGLIESELFGHERGAFTGAIAKRAGRFEIAKGGTIFLDEIGDLPLEAQAKLLRALEEREIERVGGTETVKVDVRIIAATNRNLQKAVEEKTFRPDLFFRLNVFPIVLPSLRERKEDIPLLAQYFVKKNMMKLGKEIKQISEEAAEKLRQYPWPGNIREFENIVERAVIMSDGPVLKIHDSLFSTFAPKEGIAEALSTLSNDIAKVEAEADPQSHQVDGALAHPDESVRLKAALKLAAGNRSKASRLLGISRTTLWRKLRLHKLAGGADETE